MLGLTCESRRQRAPEERHSYPYPVTSPHISPGEPEKTGDFVFEQTLSQAKRMSLQ